MKINAFNNFNECNLKYSKNSLLINVKYKFI
jgi:hypothetical protein